MQQWTISKLMLELALPRYISKIIFTSILGYNVDVGHMEAVNLISSPKYSEKQIVSYIGNSRFFCCRFELYSRPNIITRATLRSRSSCTRTRTSCAWWSTRFAKTWTI